MELFGIGAGELFLILVLALVVIGPERLPEVAGQLGRTIAELRHQANQLTSEFQRSLEVAAQERKEQRAPDAPPPSASPASAPPGSAPSASGSPGSSYCPRCGVQSAAGARFCASCGASIGERAPDGDGPAGPAPTGPA